MAYAKNKVIAGDYKDAAVESILGEVSISNRFAERLFLSTATVESYEIIVEEPLKSAALGVEPKPAGGASPAFAGMRDGAALAQNKRAHYIAVQFKDGKRSLLEVDRDLGRALIKNCLAEAKVRCEVTPEKVKLCDPQSKAHCRDCLCFPCILWPKCCYGRIYGRRAARRKNSAAKMDAEQEAEC